MGRISYLTIILALVVLCVLPLYCELKNEESLHYSLMDETDDVSESMRIKRGIQVINPYGDSSIRVNGRKQKQKESEQEVVDSKTVKRRNVLKPKSRDGEQRTQYGISEKQDVTDTDSQKSVPQKNMKSFGNKKTHPETDGGKGLQKSVPQEIKSDKKASGTMIKSVSKNKTSVKREAKLNTTKDLKSVAKKREVDVKNERVNELQKNTLDKGYLRDNTNKDQEDDYDKSCVNKNGAVKIIDETEDNNKKQELSVPAFDYFKTFPRSKQATDGNGTVLSEKNVRTNSKREAIERNDEDEKENKEEEDNKKEMKINAIRYKEKNSDENKKYNSINFKKPILPEKLSSKEDIARVKNTKISKKKT